MELEKGSSGIWKKKICLELSKLFPEKRVLTTTSTESIDFQLLVNLRTDSFHLPTSPISLAGPLAPYLMSVLLFSFYWSFQLSAPSFFVTVVPPVLLLMFLYPADVVVTHSFHYFGTTAS